MSIVLTKNYIWIITIRERKQNVIIQIHEKSFELDWIMKLNSWQKLKSVTLDQQDSRLPITLIKSSELHLSSIQHVNFKLERSDSFLKQHAIFVAEIDVNFSILKYN